MDKCIHLVLLYLDFGPSNKMADRNYNELYRNREGFQMQLRLPISWGNGKHLYGCAGPLGCNYGSLLPPGKTYIRVKILK